MNKINYIYIQSIIRRFLSKATHKWEQKKQYIVWMYLFIAGLFK